MYSAQDQTQWPDLNLRAKVQKTFDKNAPIKSSATHMVASVTDQLKQLALPSSSSYAADADHRTREQILAERKQRKIDQKREREQMKIAKQIEEIRAPKSDKIRVIDQSEAARIQNSSVEHDRRTSRRTRNIKYDLADFIDNNLSANTQPLFYHDREITTEAKTVRCEIKSKGKVREVPRAKNKSLLKKNILKSREIRQDDSSKDGVTEADVHLCHQSGLEAEPDANIESGHGVDGFSRKYRSYCNNKITPELCEVTENLLQDIFKFQDRAYNRNQIKARAHKRFVVGFKETQRQLQIDKIKLLLIAPDLEPTSTDEYGGEFTHFTTKFYIHSHLIIFL